MTPSALDTQTVADHLTTWLAEKSRTVKPTTAALYTDYVVRDLVPAFGAVRLERLNHMHVARFIDDQLAAGRGPTTVRRCVATLSSTLGDAVRQRRLQDNPARYAPLPRAPKQEQICWTPAEASAFLRYCAAVDDTHTTLFDVLIGTGLRKGKRSPCTGPTSTSTSRSSSSATRCRTSGSPRRS